MKDLIILKPGERLREIRKRLGLTQEDLAGENMSKNYISMFENNKRRINMINATYFADVLNNKAAEKGVDLNINASYFVKNEKDIARERCIRWLDNLSRGRGNTKSKVYRQLYKTIYLSREYKIYDLLAKALELKGRQLYKDRLYNCAITHFSTSLLYYVKENDDIGVKNIYLSMGKTYFMTNNYTLAITYYNLTNLTGNEDHILYYKALSYYELGKYEIAKDIINKIMFKDERVIKLENSILNLN